MTEKKLKKFIEITEDLFASIQEKEDNSWFFPLYEKQIVNRFFSLRQSNGSFRKFDSISEKDVLRIKKHLNFIDRQAAKSGRLFYQEVTNCQLQKTLVEHYKEMKIALKQENFLEFGRRACLQVECMFNFALNKLDAHALVAGDIALFSSFQPDWAHKPYNFYRAFFDGEGQPRTLSAVSFILKSIFLSIYFEYFVDGRHLKDLYFLRNKCSHEGPLFADEVERLEQIQVNFDANYTSYHKVLHDVLQGLKQYLNSSST